jgi:hypothetical protein
MAQAVAASRSVKSADDRPVSPLARPEKITFAEMREQGVRGVLVDRADCHCSRCVAISGDAGPDNLRLSDVEDRFTCTACGKRGADVRPNFNWTRTQRGWVIR